MLAVSAMNHIGAQGKIGLHKGYTCTHSIFNDTGRNIVVSPQQMRHWYGDILLIHYMV